MTSIPESSLEHERRFLVSDPGVIDDETTYQFIEQGYLWAASGYAVRVRLVDPPAVPQDDPDAVGVLTLKGPRHDATRFEQEMYIPFEIARDLIAMSNFRISKKRYAIVSARDTWVIDVFLGFNEGLIVAESEGSAEAVRSLKKPYWCGDEITDDHRYDNENLARNPFTTWNN
jgi:CYTH domain-containing protein